MSIIKENVSLKTYNTFGIDACADYFASIETIEDLAVVFSSEIAKEKKLLILGGGSNMLFTEDYKGLVVKIAIKGITYSINGDDVDLTVGGGVVWNDLVNFCVVHGFAGMENLTLIPGTVGASPIQNIGAYGVELKDIFHSCEAFEIATGEIKTFNYSNCKFGYRDSVFKNELKGKFVITSVVFRLSKNPKLQTHYGAITEELEKRNILAPTISDISAVVASIRVSKLPDPKTIGNAGSFFKNPVIELEVFNKLKNDFSTVVSYPLPNGMVKLAAGWLIEQCGFKGIVVGETGTWKNQALVLVNHGKATGREVYDFSEQIIENVYAKYGIRLEREVNIL